MTRTSKDAGSSALRKDGGEAFGNLLGGIFAGMFGLLLGLSLLKFGNPVVVKDAARELMGMPQNSFEWVLNSWPVEISYWILAVVAVAGLIVARWQLRAPVAILALPLAWFVWQVIAGTRTMDARLTHDTLIHFAGCLACFYLGVFSLGPVKRLWPFWTGLLAGYCLVLVSGFDQHFGGLEQTRRYFELYIQPNQTEPIPEDFIKRIYGNRIFATLFYANTLAGVILMLLPVSLGFIGSLKRQMTPGARYFLMTVAAMASLACLYWSGSKGGWLLMLAIGLVAAMFLPMQRRLKMALVCVALVLGLAGFFLKYAGFFEKGATSVVARFDYWRGALHAVKENPVIGTGPGTFGVMYRGYSPTAHEKPYVAHNDYLQQASDSGLPGSILYVALVAGCLVFTFRSGRIKAAPIRLAVWLALLGWALQSTVEFGLYIPAIAWPAFTFMGWLLGSGSIDSTANAPGDSLALAE